MSKINATFSILYCKNIQNRSLEIKLNRVLAIVDISRDIKYGYFDFLCSTLYNFLSVYLKNQILIHKDIKLEIIIFTLNKI